MESASLDDGARTWNGATAVPRTPAAEAVEGSMSSAAWRMRGVLLRVPQVMSCLTAAGPSSDGVGEGMTATRE
jgi:hypothetical protein